MITTSKRNIQDHRVRLKTTIITFEKLTKEQFDSDQKSHVKPISQTHLERLFQPST